MIFPETNWAALALATMNGGNEEQAALDELCRSYWKPVAMTIRGRGAPSDRVEDLTQDFFLQLMRRSAFRKVDPDKGRFRSFILGSLRYFLADDVRAQAAEKRGGHLEREMLTDDAAATEESDAQFDAAWAETIFDRVLKDIEEKVRAKRGDEVWTHLRRFLPGGDAALTYAELSEKMGISEGGAKAEVSRMRQKFRTALREEVGRTVSAPHEIDEELAHLRTALETSERPF